MRDQLRLESGRTVEETNKQNAEILILALPLRLSFCSHYVSESVRYMGLFSAVWRLGLTFQRSRTQHNTLDHYMIKQIDYFNNDEKVKTRTYL